MQPSAVDVGNIVSEGGMYLPRLDNSGEDGWIYEAGDRLAELLDGGKHMDDHTRSHRRNHRRASLPCNTILGVVTEKGCERPPRSIFRRA